MPTPGWQDKPDLKMQRRGIVTGGTWCVDRNRTVESWPAEEMLAEILSEERRGGGSACNLAIDVKKLDPTLPVETIGIVGDDDDGRLLLAEADAHEVDRTQMIITDRAATQYTDAYTSRRSGRRTHIHSPGVGALLTPDHFDFQKTTARIAHLGLPGVHTRMDAPWESDANGWVTVLKKAKAAGLTTNLELVSISNEQIRTLVRPCLPHLDLLIVNDHEIGALGMENTLQNGETDVAACTRAAHKTLADGAMRMVVVHFPTGAVAVLRERQVIRRPSCHLPPSQIVGSNGAGDAFAAGFLLGFHEDCNVPDSLKLAHAAAAASLRSVSTTDAVEPWQTCLELAAKWGEREPLQYAS
jgi:sugar/nucleoside kinase (ribokinase family)